MSMKRNKTAFFNHDSKRFNNYLEDVKHGKKKIASGALMPHELVKQFLPDFTVSLSLERHVRPELEQVTELQWNDYVEKLTRSGHLQSALAVCDVSGSMDGEPMSVAVALSLLTAAFPSRHSTSI